MRRKAPGTRDRARWGASLRRRPSLDRGAAIEKNTGKFTIFPDRNRIPPDYFRVLKAPVMRGDSRQCPYRPKTPGGNSRCEIEVHLP
ncbi:hypothetical protein HMPREF9946_04235 [Acetobacteraceae bacterium AT-5844]|nr:hypothetical protein HMPREF9946_04235 [Acetobacteraceae bacterium AT-5844]